MQNMSPPLPATARFPVEMEKWVEERRGGRKYHGTVKVSTVLISSISYQCQTVLDVCPELSAKQGSCTLDDLAFY